MRNIEGMPGISIGGYNLNNLRYADDTVLIAENGKDLQALIDIIVMESDKMGLSLNNKKTKTMVISKKAVIPSCNININGNILKQVHKFKYLGTLITSDGRCNTEIKARICQAKTAFQKMKSFLTNKKLPLELRKRIHQCYIEPVLMYACETWTINAQMERSLNATEMWFLRRMLKIPWTARKTNKEVLEKAKSKRALLNNLRKRQATFFGHVMRREKLEHLVTTGKLQGTRSCGRQRKRMQDGLSAWMRTDNMHMIASARERGLWRVMVANAAKHGT